MSTKYNQFNLIFEGPDNAGKSTVINRLMYLSEFAEFELIKCSARKSFEEEKAFAEKFCPQLFSSKACIFDRFDAISAMVYGPMLRGYYPTYCKRLLETISSASDVVTFFFTADEQTLVRRFDGEYISINNIPEMRKRYLDVYYDVPLKNKFLIDTTHQTTGDVAAYIISILNNLKK